MRTSLVTAFALLVAGCGTIGHWGSSDDGPTPYEGPSAGVPTRSGFGTPPDFSAQGSAKVPAISGGNLLVTKDGKNAVVADPDRDLVWIVDLDGGHAAQVSLDPGAEPGRVVEDGAGRVHVALRGVGQVASIDVAGARLLSRRDACASPRGLAWDSRSDVVHVACASGELVTMPAGGGAATRRLQLEADLRDVMVQSSGLLVSKFRTAEILNVGDDGTIHARRTPPDSIRPYMVPALAWRMIPPPQGGDGAAVVVHQRASRVIDNVVVTASYYNGDDCNGSFRTPSVSAAVTSFTDSQPESIDIPAAVLPVDIAVSPNGQTYAVVAAGNGHTPQGNSLFTFDSARVAPGSPDCVAESGARTMSGQLTSVAFRGDDHVVVFGREPAVIYIVDTTSKTAEGKKILLGGASVENTGHAIFHSNSGAGIACASCHAEGGDDALVWSFAKQGRRRTPSLKGTIEGTQPYHWDGDLVDVPALVHRVYNEGMSGPPLNTNENAALRDFLFSIPRPALAPPTDVDAVARGKALFEGQAGCTSCHVGPKLTNNMTRNVGTGAAFQVPSLVGVSARAPFLHNGCAATLADRFNPACGGGAQHGVTAGLSSGDVGDLVAYLSTL
jgi:hypothetical protein